MINFFERLFKKKEPLKIERKNLDNFIVNKLENSGIKIFAGEFLGQLHESIEEISEKCKELEHAELHNKNIPARAITIMEGNRKAYIQKTTQFAGMVSRIVQGINETNDSEKVLNIISEVKNHLEEYTRATQKPYFVLQEFFANESNDVASGIKQINDLLKKLENKIKKSETHKFQEVSLLLEKIKNLNEKNNELCEEKRNLEKSLGEEEKKISEINEKIKAIKNSDDFKRISLIQEELKETKDREKQLSDEISYKFSPLSRALRKFAKISLDENYVNLLFSEPFKAVAVIETEKLTGIFSNLSKNIEDKKLGLKEKVGEKYLSIISELDREFFEKSKSRINLFRNKTKELSSEIKKSGVWKKIDELNDRIDKTEKSAGQIKKEISFCDENIGKIKTDELDIKIKDILRSMGIELEG